MVAKAKPQDNGEPPIIMMPFRSDAFSLSFHVYASTARSTPTMAGNSLASIIWYCLPRASIIALVERLEGLLLHGKFDQAKVERMPDVEEEL